MQKVTIIGWTDGFWKWMADFILKNFRDKIDLTITWRNEEKGKKVAKELNCKFSSKTREVIIDSDITIFAVSIAYFLYK
jgi:plasmid replication initiation protein